MTAKHTPSLRFLVVEILSPDSGRWRPRQGVASLHMVPLSGMNTRFSNPSEAKATPRLPRSLGRMETLLDGRPAGIPAGTGSAEEKDNHFRWGQYGQFSASEPRTLNPVRSTMG